MATNDNKSASSKLTMLEAKGLLIKKRDNLTEEMKDSIIDALSQEVHSTLAQARHLWAKKKPLNQEQSALLMEWMWGQVDHTKVDSKTLVLVTKTDPEPQSVPLFGASYFGSPAPTSVFCTEAKVCVKGFSMSPAGITLLVLTIPASTKRLKRPRQTNRRIPWHGETAMDRCLPVLRRVRECQRARLNLDG
jgi:hypothetical protein